MIQKQCTCKYHKGERLLLIKEFAICKPNKTYPDGIRNMCKKCLSIIRKNERNKNKDRIQKEQKIWRNEHKEYIASYGKEYRSTEHGKQIRTTSYIRNRQQKRDYDRNRRQNEPGVREKYNYTAAKYRAAKLQAIPKWFESEKDQIKNLYRIASKMRQQTHESYHVDHIIPLQGETVCGLHTLCNLQLLSKDKNFNKSNKLLPEYSGWEETY